jgi:hypothetical protein
MTTFIASMVLSAGFWIVPAVSIPASAFFQNSTRALMPLPHDSILLARGGRSVGVAKPVGTKPRIDADLNKRGIGREHQKVCRPASPALECRAGFWRCA